MAITPSSTPAPGYTSNHPSDPSSYIRDPHKLIAYIIPFPTPSKTSPNLPTPPLRFVIYTPPPPPLLKPTNTNEKEHLSHKVQRKWQEEVKAAKSDPQKLGSWKGVKGRVTKGIDKLVGKTTSADLDFVTRIPKDGDEIEGYPTSHSDLNGDIGEGKEEKGTVKLEEMVLVYPPSLDLSPDQLKTEFVNNMMRTKSKAEKDAVIATGLLPVAAALDWALIFVGWIFGGALEIDGVWAASSIRGAKITRSITKRLHSTSNSNDQLKLTFHQSSPSIILQNYLQAACHLKHPEQFAAPGASPTEDDVLEAIGWQPSDHRSSSGEGAGGGHQYEDKNWEDDAWEKRSVEDDLKVWTGKAVKSWTHWLELYEKNPKKAEKK